MNAEENKAIEYLKHILIGTNEPITNGKVENAVKTLLNLTEKLKIENEELKNTKNNCPRFNTSGVSCKLKQEDYISKNKIIKFIENEIASEDYMEDDIDTDIEPASYDKYINSRKLLEFVEEQENYENK